MKSFALAAILAAATSHADQFDASWNTGFNNDGHIPDGNITGWSDTRLVAGLTGIIVDVNVSLNILGGFNGDYYVYLEHDSGISILVNRVGRTSANPFGSFDSGLNVDFDDAATRDIHAYDETLNLDGLAWRPDGRYVNPLSVLDTDSPTHLLSQFLGHNPNGEWTLFVADLSNGEVGEIANWSLSITTETQPVPEANYFIGASLILMAALAHRRGAPQSRPSRE